MNYKLFLSSVTGYSFIFLTIYFFFPNFSITFLNNSFIISAISFFILLFLIVWQQKFFTPFFIFLKSFSSKIIKRENAIVHFSNEQRAEHAFERNIPYIYQSLIVVSPIFFLSITFSFLI